MLKYIKGHMATIDGIELYPIISLVIFFAFFTLVIYNQVKADKSMLAEVERYPLDCDDSNTNTL